MRSLCLLIITIGLTACTTSLERQAGATAKDDCRQQARAYIRANMASVANEWRDHEEYKHYQQCLARQVSSSS